MPFNGSGVFQRVRNWVADAAAGIKIRADYHDSEDDNLAAGLSNCITRDGQSIVTQNIPFNGKRITGLADPVNPQDAATKASTDGRVLKAGDTMTGDLTLQEAAPKLILDTTGAAGIAGQNQIHGRVNGLDRWVLYFGYGGSSEPGGNVGSDLYINSFDDAGNSLTTAMKIERSNGRMSVAGDPLTALGVVTKQYSDTSVGTRVSRGGDIMTGDLRSKTAALAISNAAAMGTFEVRGSEASQVAGMTFHAENIFASNFGMKSDGNFYMGGFSHGAGNEFKFWTTREVPTAPILGVRLQLAGNVNFGAGGAGVMYEPFAGGVITGWQYVVDGGGSNVVSQFRVRYLQYQTAAGWFTVGVV